MFHAELVKSGSAARDEVRAIMDRIFKENPSYWPYGLDDRVDWNGGLYMVREASTRKPVGFTGWQILPEGGKQVGYYSIGILPEYRNNGFAKAAVAELIKQKAATVDAVKAFIMPDNKPSHELARSLQVEVTHGGFDKAATLKEVAKAVGLVGAGGGLNAAFWDWRNHPEAKLPFQGEWDRNRAADAVLNSVLGAPLLAAPVYMKDKGMGLLAGLGAAALTPVKDLAANAIPTVREATPLLQQIRQGDKTNTAAMLAGGLGVGALGLTTLLGLRSLARAIQNQTRTGMGRVRVTLPTKNPSDAETQIELPIEDVQMSRNMQNALSRDTRRRIREESLERKWRRDEKTKKLVTRAEPGQLRLLESIAAEKAASATRADKLQELQELLS